MSSRMRLDVLYDGQTSTRSILEHFFRWQEVTSWLEVREISEKDLSALPNRSTLLVRPCSPDVGLLFSQRAPLNIMAMFDDNFWLLDDQTELGQYYSNALVRRSLNHIAGRASGLICSSRRMAGFLAHFNNNVSVAESPVELHCRVAHSDLLDEGEKRIGIVLNISKVGDYNEIRAVISKVLELRNDVVFEFFGWAPEDLRSNAKVRFHEPIDHYGKFIDFLDSRRLTAALAPLADRPASHYKTNNKYRDFACCQIAGIYSAGTVYDDDVINGENGWLASNGVEWEEIILSVLDDAGRASQVGMNALKDVKLRYSKGAVAESWKGALERGLPRKRSSVARKLTGLASACFEKINGKIELHDWFPILPRHTISCEIKGAHAGKFTFAVLIGTFNERIDGQIVICVCGGSRQEFVFNGPFVDGHQLHFSVVLRDGSDYVVRMRANTSSAIAAYRLSPLGSTKFGNKIGFGAFVG